MEARDKHSALTAERLREILSYDPMTGVFMWLRPQTNRVQPGARADRIHKGGYRIVKIGACIYLAHRLAWLYATGNWPQDMLDHISATKADNRLVNLREATRGQNNANRPVQVNTKSGLKGVYRRTDCESRWNAAIRKNGKTIHLGSFSSPEEAAAAYQKAATSHFGQFARTA